MHVGNFRRPSCWLLPSLPPFMCLSSSFLWRDWPIGKVERYAHAFRKRPCKQHSPWPCMSRFPPITTVHRQDKTCSDEEASRIVLNLSKPMFLRKCLYRNDT